MIKFATSGSEDLYLISDWIAADLDHHNKMPAEWWLTGSDCVFAGCLEDDIGPLMYIRVDKEGDLARLHCQFAPEDQVSKKLVVLTLIEVFPKFAEMISSSFKGIVFESISESLINFMIKLGFVHSSGNDYVLKFEVI